MDYRLPNIGLEDFRDGDAATKLALEREALNKFFLRCLPLLAQIRDILPED